MSVQTSVPSSSQMSHPGIERKKAGFLVEEVTAEAKKADGANETTDLTPIPLHEPAMKIATIDRHTAH